MENDKKKNRLFIIYVIIGFLYVVVKVGFVSAGYLHPGAILHGAVPGAVTIITGFTALKFYAANKKAVLPGLLMIVFPLVILVTTPLYMYLKEKDMWLVNGRLSVLLIYEVMAVIQFLQALKAGGDRR